MEFVTLVNPIIANILLDLRTTSVWQTFAKERREFSKRHELTTRRKAGEWR
jgi:hypothetical protein